MTRGARALASTRALGPCTGCPSRSSCRSPCEQLESHLEPVPSLWRSLPLFERRLTAPAPLDDDGPWARHVEALVPQIPELLDALPQREQFILRNELAGHSRRAVARALGLSRDTVTEARQHAVLQLRRKLQVDDLPAPVRRLALLPSPQPEVVAMKKNAPAMTPATAVVPITGRCAVQGCRRTPVAVDATLPELRPFCPVHRHLREQSMKTREQRLEKRAALKALPPPNLELAEQICGPSETVEHRFESISPSLALALLERNTHNRPISDERVQVYARDMRAGVWQDNNQGIAFGRDGKLYDGQHRLWAVVESQATVRMLVVRGLPPEARETIDQGRSRTLSDTLQIVDGEQDAARMISWLRAIECLHGRSNRVLSTHDARELINRHRASLTWLSKHGPRQQPFSRAPVMGALAYAHIVLGAEIEPFIVGYTTGASLPPGHPALALRNYVAERLGQKTERARVPGVKALRCVLGYLKEETMDRLQPSEEGYDYLRKREAQQARAAE